jgi:lipoprotein-anchoring transpeptidase ErfK/SrfK
MDKLARAIAILALVLVAGCTSSPKVELDREAVRRSVEASAAMLDPLTQATGSAELDEPLRAAIRESARVEARLRWWPLTERTDLEAWSRVAHLAATRARDIRARRANLETEWLEASRRAGEALDEVRRHPLRPPSPKAEAHLRTAALELDLANALSGEGRLPDAIDAAARSLDASGAVLRERDRRMARFGEPANLHHWETLAKDTISDSARTRSSAIVVDKFGRKLYLYDSGKLRLTFDVELGSGALARKLHQGDGATPEGRYRVREVRGPASTRYYRALLLDYPNEVDWKRFREAKRRGEIPERARIGGLIEIHGQGGKGRDWTEGCVALTDPEMDRLVKWVRVGTPVTIVGRLR